RWNRSLLCHLTVPLLVFPRELPRNGCPPLPYTTLFRSCLARAPTSTPSATITPLARATAATWACGSSVPVDLRSLVIAAAGAGRSEEHTSELQSRFDLVCRLLLEKKKADRDLAAASSKG